MSEADLAVLKKEVWNYYDSLKKVYCPYLKDYIFFTSEGFEHMIFKSSKKRKIRSIIEQMTRLRLFKYSPQLLKITTTVQELRDLQDFVPIKMKKKQEVILKKISYWGFIAVISEKRIKVIIRQIGEGEKHFWSIIPYWNKSLNKKHLLTA